MTFFLLENDLLGQVRHNIIDPRTHEPLIPHLLELFPVIAFPVFHNWRQDLDPCALGQGKYRLHDIPRSLCGNLRTAVIAKRLPDPGIEHSQVIIYLSDRAECGAGAPAYSLLVYRYG